MDRISNLGSYQTMTTLAKKVGGPNRLAILLAAFGYGILRGCEAGVKAIVKNIQNNKLNFTSLETKKYIVKSNGESNEGLQFMVGDSFRILETVEDAILIEKIGDYNNPYFVSNDLLEKISDYKKGE